MINPVPLRRYAGRLRRYARRLQFYLLQIWQHRQLVQSGGEVYDWLRRFPDWQRSLDSTPMSDRRPWITYGAIEFLNSALRADMRVCEYGVGGSTLFFVDRVSQLVSIEHDADWADQIKALISNDKSECWRIHVVPPGPGSFEDVPDPNSADAYVSTWPEYKAMSFREYASTIDAYPDEFFDVVQVDGRARHCCVKHAVSKIKRNGLLVLDDAHREQYADAHRRLAMLNWKKQAFFGPGPYEGEFRTTCIWQRTH